MVRLDQSAECVPMGEMMPGCGLCRFFVASPEMLDEGQCRRRAPDSVGWPAVSTADWCGEFTASDAPAPDDVDAALAALTRRLDELDERMAAVELSVTAAQFQITHREP